MRHLTTKFKSAIFALFLLIGLNGGATLTGQAQQPYRISDRQISDILRRLEQNSERFRSSLDSSLDRSRRDGTRSEDDINAFVRDFDGSVEQLRDNFNGRRSVASDVENILQKASVIDSFVNRNPAGRRSASEWALVRTDLNTLANAYGVSGQGGYRNSNDDWRNRDDNRNDDWRNRDDNNRRGRNWDRYGNYGGSFDLRQTALNAGYNEGVKVGRDDRSRNRSVDYRNSSKYQKATDDYSTRLGDRELYRRYYRDGFENGYNDGYGITATDYPQDNNDRDWSNNNGNRRGRNWGRYGTYGGSAELRQTALNAGYNEGMKVGRNDRNRSRSTNYRNSSEYQKATKDYSNGLGDLELYRRYFREGFETGYNDGYNGY